MNEGKGKDMVPDGTGLLYGYFEQMYKGMFEKQLDILEYILILTAPKDKDEMFVKLKSKILRLGNNSLRQVQDELRKYDIRPKDVVHDIVVPPQNRN